MRGIVGDCAHESGLVRHGLRGGMGGNRREPGGRTCGACGGVGHAEGEHA